MIKYFLPKFNFSKITDIDQHFFMGAELIIFDIDNTLIFPETTKTKQEIVDWFSQIKNRYNCICLSNSRTIFKRHKKISEVLGCKIFLSKHKKPFSKLFKEIKNQYGLKDIKVFVVGDRIFTDILFGNLNGAITILVKPLTEKENFFIKIIRHVEKFLLFLINSVGYNKY